MEVSIGRKLLPLPQEILDTIATSHVPLHHPVRATTCFKQIRRLTTLLGQEAALLHKVRYKQKNQHAAATWWRHLSGSHRVARRVLEELDGGLLPILPLPESTEPQLHASALLLAVQACLRLLLLLNQTLSYHDKAAAATQQLLRAALFMPLALAAKAMIARFHSIWISLKEELNVLLGLLRSSHTSSFRAGHLQMYLCSLPSELLSVIPLDLSNKTLKLRNKRPQQDRGLTFKSLQVPSSAIHSAAPSPSNVGEAPDMAQTAGIPRSAAPREATQIQRPDEVDMPPRVPEQMQVKKRKKRKQDDIDAIFAGI